MFRLPVLALVVAATTLPAHGADADRIWKGGTILTMNDAAMRAEAVAVRDGRILAVGTEKAVMAHRGSATEVVDLGGRALLPGFVDSHGHVFMGGLQALSANLLAPPDGAVTDIVALQRTIRDWMSANREIVERIDLVIGFGYDNAQLAEIRHPTRDDLDAVSTRVPIVLIHQSGHIGALNTKALEAAGIDAASGNPPGGVIRRRPDGQPDGVLEETAFFTALLKLIPRVGEAGAKAMVRAGADLWARFGYTTAQEGRTEPTGAELLRAVADEGGLAIDVVAYSDVLADREYIVGNVATDYRNRYRLGGAKLTIDGSPQGFTAWRDRPYYAPVGDYPPGYSGYPAVSNERVIDAVEWAYEKNVQLLAHSNGEAATDLLIAAHDFARRTHGSTGRRDVLIHGQFLREDQVAALDRLGIFPSLFPMHTFYWGDWHREHTVGPVNAENISPTGWVLARGMMFGSHHDAPVAFPDSMRVLDATVTRRTRSGDILGPAHRVDVVTALKAMTLWPAWQHFEEAQKGSIETGKLADFVVLSQDPTAIDPETLDRLEVLETIKEGKTVFVLDTGTAHAMQSGAGVSQALARLLVAIGSHDAPSAYGPGQGSREHVRFAAPAGPTCMSDGILALTAAVLKGRPAVRHP
jgi:predicted amidohydrolase YtcJ